MYVCTVSYISEQSLQPTNSDGLHDSTTATITVSGHYADSVDDIVGYS